MDSLFMSLDKESLLILAIIVSGCSIIIGSLLTLITTWLTKRSEERRYFQGLIVNTAIANWKRSCETLNQSSGGNRFYMPLDHYLLHMVRFSEMFLKEKQLKRKLKFSEIRKNIRELKRMQAMLEKASSEELTDEELKFNE